jgi:DNA-binding transcriptional ArsR family regulator
MNHGRHWCRSKDRVVQEIGRILARGVIASTHRIEVGKSEPEAPAHLEQRKPETAEEILRDNTGYPLTCSAIARALGVSNSTARNQLKQLLEDGLVERHGRGPSTTYSLKPQTK